MLRTSNLIGARTRPPFSRSHLHKAARLGDKIEHSTWGSMGKKADFSELSGNNAPDGAELRKFSINIVDSLIYLGE